VQTICVAIDVEARRITIEPPDGLLELNEKRTRNQRIDESAN
jgi:hypothetical protein